MNNYKPVLPSSLLEERTELDMNFSKKISENAYLRLGVVTDIIEIEDENNLSKFMTEYEVMTIEDDNTSLYKNCISVDAFGGIADYFVKKLRKPKDSKKVRKSASLKKQNGSIVLLLCIDGSSDQGIILGAIPHPDRKKALLKKEDGQHLEGEFNGLNWKIDKDGALTITFKTASDNDGKYKESAGKVGGTHIQMDKNGQVDINTNLKGDEETYMRMDKKNKDVGLKAGRHIGFTAKQNIGLIAEKNISAKATADLLADAGGSITAKSGGAFNVKAEGAFMLQAASVQVQSDGDVKVKGTAITLSAPQVMVGDGGSPAIILSTQFLGIGNVGAPVISTSIGPFSSSVFIAS